jgi:hypothetical protein
MLGIIAGVLIVLWLLGFFAFHVSTGLIHIHCYGPEKNIGQPVRHKADVLIINEFHSKQQSVPAIAASSGSKLIHYRLFALL